jgi:NADH-quinone oxidoreductase subunit N
VTFYVLNSFQRRKLVSLEAGVKYLILGALSSAFMVYGIALVFGLAGSMNFNEVAAKAPALAENKLFLLGLLFVLAGLGFKIAAFPFQIWVPDVYQGSPTPATAFLAVGSKAAGFVLLLRVLFGAVPQITEQWSTLLMIISAATILYGNLCAIPQRGLKRLLGYSSIANAGYLLLGVTAMSDHGQSAILYYLAGYLFTVLGAFAVLTIVLRNLDTDDISALAGLNQRSPLLAATLTLAMVSLAGIPPLAGFMGKFLLLKSVVEVGTPGSGHFWLLGVAIVGVVISLYYYFGVIRAIYWSRDASDTTAIELSAPLRVCLAVCIAGMLFLGLFPGAPLDWAEAAVRLAMK